MADDAVLFALLEEVQVAYERYDHETVFTVAEAQDIASHLPGLACRDLLRLVEHLGNSVRCLAVPGSLEPACD